MAIQWGAWEYSGGNGMRVGIDVSRTNVGWASTACVVTFKVYTENQYGYGDGQSLSISGTASWADASFSNNQGGGAVLRATRSYTYDFDSNDYGSGTAKTVSMTATLSGAYNGVTPSKTVSINIPKRPIAQPEPPTGFTADRIADNSIDLSWVNHSTAGQPYGVLEYQRWINIGEWGNLLTIGASNVSASWGGDGNRRYRWRIRARNDAGASAWEYSNYVQTTPAAPTSCTATKSSTTSVLVKWNNSATTANGYDYDTLLEENVGGTWTAVATLAAGTTSYNRTNLVPGTVYQYRVRARSTVGDTTYSAYSTSDSIQLQSPPAAPTVVSTVRTSDYSFTLNWSNNPDAETAPYDSLVVQRLDFGAWQTIASLSPLATSLTDTSTTLNRSYQWRIHAVNAAGVSEWVYFTTYQTKPADPSSVVGKAAPGGAIRVSWVNNAGYSNYTTKLRYYKNGVLVDDTIVLASGTASYLIEDVDLTATYYFGVKTLSTVGYSSESAWVDSAPMAAATVPNAPSSLNPNGTVRDMLIDQEFTWVHVPSTDASDQTKFEIQVSTDDGGTWTSLGEVTDTESSYTIAGGTYSNGSPLTWQVRTWGVHADPSPWSASAVVPTSTTPTVTLVEPAGTTVETSLLTVQWVYGDAESTPQAHWEVELYDDAGSLLEAKSGDGEGDSVALTTVVVDSEIYVLRIRLTDGDGLSTGWISRTLLAQFTPPAMPDLSATYDQDAGVTVITLTPTEVVEGESLPPTGVDLQRRLLVPETQTWDEWETLATGLTAQSTVVDTTAPIASDGEYRIIAYSAAPSARTSPSQPPTGSDDRWVYLSGGTNFTQVCRLMGNVGLRITAERERTLYNFAGRKKPVLFAGEARNRSIQVSGLLDAESSTPPEWEHLIESCDVMLFRDPLGHRMYGSVPQVDIDHIGGDMYAISFTVTQVEYP